MDKDLQSFFRQAKEVRLQAGEKEALRPAFQAESSNSVRAGDDACQNSHMAWSFDRFITASQTLRLTDRERTQSFERLLAFMEAHPVMLVPDHADKPSPLASLFALFSTARFMPALAFALILLIGAGTTSVAAESALPGTALYPVKIHVNEAVRSAFAASPEARAKLQNQLVERRLDEARALAAQGAIDPSVQTGIAAAIAEHVAQARQDIVVLSQENDLDAAAAAATALDASVKANQKVFSRIARSRAGSVDLILGALAEADAGSASASVDLQSKISAASADAAQAIAAKSIEAAERRADAVKAFIERNGAGLNAQAKTEVEARLKSAKDAIAQARIRLQEGSAAAALGIAAQASTDAQEGQALGSVQQLITVEVNASGDGDGQTNIDVKATGDAKPLIKVGGNGKATVKVNGQQVSLPAAASSTTSASASSRSRATQQQTSVSVQINQQTSAGSANTTVNNSTNVNASTNVNVQGGGSVQIHQSAGVKVNNVINVGD